MKATKTYLKKYQKRIGQLCKESRVKMLLTQEDVAKITGYTRPQISKFESGSLASYFLLIYYVAFLGTKIEDILKGV